MKTEIRKEATTRSKSGHIGVFWVKEKRKWKAKITVNGSEIFLGYFFKIESAITARIEAEKEYGVFKKTKTEKYGQWLNGKLIGKHFVKSHETKDRINEELTQRELKNFLNYDVMSGDFSWLIDVSNKTKAGDISGYLDKYGYRQICIFNKKYAAHRLAWLYVYGSFPVMDLDHINGVKNDNRISNLRQVTKSENSQNRIKAQVNNKLGVLGVSKVWKKNSYLAKIQVNGKEKKLGQFKTIEQAVEARKKAEIIYYVEKIN
jgi:HNH endonuclease